MKKNEIIPRLIFFLLIICWCIAVYFFPIGKVHTLGHYESGLLDYHSGNLVPDDKTEFVFCSGYRFFHVLGFWVYFYIFFPILPAAEILLFKRPLKWYWIVLLIIQFLAIILLTPIFLFLLSWRLDLFTNSKNEYSPEWGAWVAIAQNAILSLLLFSSVFFRKDGLALLYRKRK